MEHYAILGFGSAGFNALKAIREAGCDAELDVYSDHSYPPSNPMLTTYFIKGKISFETMFPFGTLEEIAVKYRCNIYHNTQVLSLDASSKELTLSDGSVRSYDKILISTGASPVRIPVGSLPAERIHVMRTVDDAKRLCEKLETGTVKKMLVVGASWVGIKVVEVAWARGIDCVLVDLAPHIFMASAFERASQKCEEYLVKEGIDIRFGVKTEDCYLSDEKCHVTFSDGSETDVDLVVMCIGIRPACDFIDRKQIQTEKGIIVDHNMMTSVKGIYAAGDVTEANELITRTKKNIGLWANSSVQGRCAGLAMAGRPKPIEGNILHNITHFLNYTFISFGDKTCEGERRVLLDKGDRYIEVLVNDDKLYCINMLADFELSGVVKNCIMKYFAANAEPLNELELGVLAKSGFPNELIRILGGMVQ